jgi:DNA-binding MarR family transcriptional regulator
LGRSLKSIPSIFPLDNNRDNDYILRVTSTNTNSRTLSTENRLFVALLKAADAFGLQAEQLLKSAGLTGAQYNVLRILRGAEPEGLPCRGIGERMISHDPDITRLLDRMEKRALIIRERQTDDRRVVKTRITKKGLETLKALDQPVRDLHKRQFRHIPAARLKFLAEVLEEIQPPEEQCGQNKNKRRE